ncbi:MAG: hypothetical protein A2946_01975 [Candidatus Liptonbacteria bacterium RIFCSPLOWO2_01_FULL_53_13]|uniref:Glycosyltransferase 2-like domain-containing protein n=1 Tax=Candidatus Liptonbacteria bacterium RIFCSPLOWO2_01_FULL_53_13 TaxID=1798651 RepID=A0A1G2CME2_9BACT|nr:MAG: hypothetical protein A2946_01975 [Candidatus Liptonbacteria bacterium RIFCSPLOWO2_01_FULL_53_13]
MPPKVTILLATWNRAKMLPRAIESLQRQTFTDWEIVIADDGSTDETPEVVEAWQKKLNPAPSATGGLVSGEKRIVYVRNRENQGISKNYNTGFRVARGEYIAMIDDDDPWCDNEKLAKQVKFLEEHRDYVGCGGGVIVVDERGKEKYRYLKPETDKAIRAKMLFSNPMANSTTLFRKSTGEKVGWYDETTRYSGDRDFWLKAGLIGKLYNFPEYFSYYTMTGGNTSISKIRPHLKASLMITKRYKGKYPRYYLALAFNELQYAYAFVPEFIRKRIHTLLARLKRFAVT